MRKAILRLALLAVCSASTSLYAIEFDSTVSISNELTKDFKNETALNPGNMLEIGYPLTDTLLLDADCTLYFNEIWSLNLADSAFVSYSSYQYEFAEQKEWDYENRLKQLYATAEFNSTIFIDLGRKVESDGVSFYKNPSDFFVNRDSRSLSRSKEEQLSELSGVTLGKVEYFVNERLVIDAIYSPKYSRIENEMQQAQARVSYQFESSDVNLICYYGEQFKLGTNISGNLGDSAEIHLEFGIAEEGERANLDRVEQASEYKGSLYLIDESTMQKPWEVILGGHYTFKDASELYAEYYYNHIGYTKREWDNLIDVANECSDISDYYNKISIYQVNSALQKTGGGITAARRHYLFFRYSKDDMIWQDFNLRALTAFGLEEFGGFYTLSPGYDINDNMEATIDFTLFAGTEKSEFELLYSRFSASALLSYTF